MAQPVGAASLLSLENEVFRSFLFYSSILILKMMFMSAFTGLKRFKYKAFANTEDAGRLKLKPRTEENVERVRRAHLNDLENISLFYIGGLIYTLTNPAIFIAKTIFLVYTVARIFHTIVYAVCPLPQPARGISWMIGYSITGYMAVTGLLHFL